MVSLHTKTLSAATMTIALINLRYVLCSTVDAHDACHCFDSGVINVRTKD